MFHVLPSLTNNFRFLLIGVTLNPLSFKIFFNFLFGQLQAKKMNFENSQPAWSNCRTEFLFFRDEPLKVWVLSANIDKTVLDKLRSHIRNWSIDSPIVDVVKHNNNRICVSEWRTCQELE